MAATHRGVGSGSMFTSVKKESDDLESLKTKEASLLAEIETLTNELPERRKAFDELLKKRSIINDAIKKLEMQLMVERVNLKAEEES